MNSTATIYAGALPENPDAFGTGRWTDTPERPVALSPRLWAYAVRAGVPFLVGVVLSIADPWVEDRWRPTSSRTFVASFSRRRRISIFEARRIALEIGLQAEQERLQIAEEEARRGIQWEEQS